MNYITNLFKLYAGNGVLMGLYLAAWVVIVVLEKKKENKIAFAFSAWYLPLVIVNPLVGTVLERFHMLPERIVRIYWLLPVFFAIAYGGALLLQRMEAGFRMGTLSAAIIVMGLIYAGIPIVTEENFVKAENIYKLPDGVIQIVDMINEDAKNGAGEGKAGERKAAMPLSLSTYARQYDGTLPMLYGRYPEDDEATKVYEMMQWESVPVEAVREKAKAEGCLYLVLDDTKEWTDMPQEELLEFIGSYGNYCLYRLN